MHDAHNARTARRAATAPLRRRATVAGAVMAAALLTASCGTDEDLSDDGIVRPVGGSSDLGSGYPGGGYGGSEGYGGSGDAGANGDSGAYGDGGSGGGARTGAAKTLRIENTAELGQVVTDSEGWTLYRFEDDSADPPASACTGACAETWPPVPAEDAAAAAGIRASQLGRVQREDGSWQLTLGGRPVYRYAGDTAPGDTSGHGVGGTWYALSPNGGRAGDAGAGAADGAADGAAQLEAVRNEELGTILVDAEGRTLYRFDEDTAWPMKSNCTGPCLDTWKPAKPVDEDRLDGVAAGLVSVYERPDGTRQLAIDCWPVYRFTGDDGPGDTNGHGKQGLWSAVTDEGGRAGAV